MATEIIKMPQTSTGSSIVQSGLVFAGGGWTLNGTSDTGTFTPCSLNNASFTSGTFLIDFLTTRTGSSQQELLNSNDTNESPRITFATGTQLQCYYLSYGIKSTQNISANIDYKLMLRWSPSGGVNDLYLNKVQGIDFFGSVSTPPNFNKQYRIGAYISPVQWFFEGSIKYLAIYNRTITNEEAIQMDYLA